MSSVVSSRRVRPALKWSVARLRAIVINQAPKSLPCQRKLLMLRSARKNVSDVRSSASAEARERPAGERPAPVRGDHREGSLDDERLGDQPTQGLEPTRDLARLPRHR